MNILIIGGTRFLGRALIEAALARNHTLTLFNRGQSNPDLFPDLEQIHGDRDNEADLAQLGGRQWDAVIDTCGYLPRVVRKSAMLLANATRHYTFISSLSVYDDFSQPDYDESAPVGRLEDETVEEITGDTYGPLKALCEEAVETALPGRTLNIRPGLIVGPYDASDRFTYWPARLDRGGEVLAPGRPERYIQFIDVRDLAEWTVRMVENGQTGVYNADGPAWTVTMQNLLEACQVAAGKGPESAPPVRITWVSEDFLAAQNVGSWMEMPLWVPESDPDNAGFFASDIRKAMRTPAGAGLSFRPLMDTVRATLEWARSRPADYAWRAGLSADREEQLLLTWHA